ncbi:MAG: L-lysine 6-transaminase [Candidatus Eisenbacteria bacterium]|nr:L-lysine 6-transaminase [Candidatus Eisenbacteria bacterium]
MPTGADARTVTPDTVHETIGSHMLADGFDIVLDLDKSEGSYLFDSRSRQRYLDLFTCFASSPIGFNHPKMRDPEFVRMLGRVAVNKPSNSDLYTVELAEFVDAFARLAAPPELPHLFFVSGGTLAVENALKAAFDWKVRKNIQKGVNSADAPERELKGTQVIHFEQAFHGRSGYTLPLTNTFDPRKTKYFPKFDWPRVPNPKIRFPLDDESLEDVKIRERQSLEAVRKALSDNPDDVAAIIIEPIQGEGGDNHFRPEFLQGLRSIADENDVILVFDEIQCGMGLTGTMWAFQQMGVVPDIAAFGKKAQVCGIMASDRMLEVEGNVFQESSRINSTWGGNLVDMVRCRRYLEIMHEEDMLSNAAEMGKRLLSGLESAAAASGGRLSNVRGRGLMCAFDLATTDDRADFLHDLREQGVLALPCGEKTVRFRPPLNISEGEVDAALAAIGKASG